MNTIIEKIRAEVNRQRTYYNLNNPYDKRAIRVCNNILSTLGNLEKECEKPNDQDVNLAANNWICSHKDGEILYIKPAFIAGAEWQKEQMLKEAVEGIVTTRSMAGNIVTAHIDHQFKDGQKVKLIIVKED